MRLNLRPEWVIIIAPWDQMSDYEILNRSNRTASSKEILLLDRLHRITADSHGYFAVHIVLSELLSANKQSHFMTVASRSFDILLDSTNSTLLSLKNQDLVLICRNVPIDDVDTVIDKVRTLFREDPLVASEESGFDDTFAVWYDLSSPEDSAAFTAIAKNLALIAEQQRKDDELLRKADEKKGTPLDPTNVSKISEKLKVVRIADMIRQQVCLKVDPSGGGGEIVFHETFISMGELRDRIAPDVNMFTSPWLFQYLTESLDRRMIGVLCEHEITENSETISLNLNISTVLSRDFQRFNHVVGKHTDKVVIEMQMIDIFADMNNYGYARDSLQERGYRVVVDGLNPLTLQFFDPTVLQSDFIKIAWSQDLEGKESHARMAEMRDVISHAGKESIILARIDTEKAIKWGIGMGIRRFQGFLIDKMADAVGIKGRTM